ncbi:ATP-dependent RNA helicase [Corynebacterium caspium]|uniref:ATP-dependent RNA helicase n=1 Tax=Corynebacterium caspium TaxID=234828 RepID=UPI0003712D47|nr:ATP-dependent RNA helicase [Corynebacterium caspium]WKD58500.1 ATP-dependent RNA helicase HrpB [Corynebacterium caspium DSM 44850]
MLFDLPQIGAGLPVFTSLPAVTKALNTAAKAVIQAPPGTGKTTLIPPLVANICGAKTLVVAPRRVAVRAAAQRLAELSHTTLGKEVGYRMRGETRAGSQVEFITPGVMIRLLLNDPELRGIAAVIVDEVHERQLDTDLALGMLVELQQLRDDFTLVAMSATVDAPKFQQLLDGAPLIETPAVLYPVETIYQPHPGRATRSREFWETMGRTASKYLTNTGHSVLVFVPGVREVAQVLAAAGPQAVPLHGRLDSAAQQAALRQNPDGSPRIVVATSIAESSVTVSGVRVVIDAGLSRVPRRDAGRGMTGLVTVSAARSTITQRAGRAGREGPGQVVWMFSAAELRHFPAHPTPEILAADLTQAALWLAAWGSPALPLLDPAPPLALRSATETLKQLKALTSRAELTALGKKLVSLPLDPRLGRAVLESGGINTVAAILAGLSGNLSKVVAPRAEVQRLEKLLQQRDSGVPAGEVIGLAFPQQIARLQADSSAEFGGEYLLASGTRAQATEELRGFPWLAIAEVQRSGNRALIRSGAPITEARALEIIGVEETIQAHLHNGALVGRAIRRAGAIELSAHPVEVPQEIAVQALAATLQEQGLGIFHFSEKAQHLYERLLFLHARCGAPWPDPQADLEWLAPELAMLAAGKPVSKIELYPALKRLLPWPEAANLAKLAPPNLQVPSGSQIKLRYDSGRPVARVKLQECFGLADSPQCAGVRVQFHLLSPAGRELAITDSLESFWNGPYQQVRAEMRGRYPKHPWPEDPWQAPATARTKRREQR